MKRYVFLTLGILSLLAIVSACKDPVKPIEEIPQEREDTVHSFARADIRTPSMNATWEVRTPDTLWNGVTTITQPNGITTTRNGLVLRNNIGSAHIIGESSAAIGITIWNNSDLVSKLYVYQDYSIDSVHSWREQRLGCDFRAPKQITVPLTLTIDSLYYFEWSEAQWQEQEVPVSNRGITSWVLRSLFGILLSAKYSPGSPWIEEKSKILQASLTIEKYDAVKRRMSGRFSFKVIGSLKNEMIEIQNGVFENAYMRMR
jgi:hypothetical protein